MTPGIFHRFKNHFKRPKNNPEAESSASHPSLDDIYHPSTSSTGPTFFANAHDFTIQKQTIVVGSSMSLFDRKFPRLLHQFGSNEEHLN